MDDRLRQELIAYFDYEVGRPPRGFATESYTS